MKSVMVLWGRESWAGRRGHNALCLDALAVPPYIALSSVRRDCDRVCACIAGWISAGFSHLLWLWYPMPQDLYFKVLQSGLRALWCHVPRMHMVEQSLVSLLWCEQQAGMR